jgi:hypothetical protein
MNSIIIIHSLLRYGVVLFGIWTVINAISGLSRKRDYSRSDNLSNLLFMISCDIQLLLGLILYFGGTWFSSLKSDAGSVMGNSMSRFFAVEHISMMLLAWVLVHIGRVKVKKAETDIARHRKMLIFFGIAFFLIMISIPWPFRTALGKGWLPVF